MIRSARLAGTLPAARRDTNMSAIVGQDAMAKVARALAASGDVRQLLTDAHLALTATQKQVGLGTRMFGARSEEHTSELQSLMRISYAVFCLKKNNTQRVNRRLT